MVAEEAVASTAAQAALTVVVAEFMAAEAVVADLTAVTANS